MGVIPPQITQVLHLTSAGPLIQASENDPNDSKGLYLTKQEVIGNSWILLFAGHETSGNTIHYSFLFLAIALNSQARLQAEIDSIVESRPPSDWTYETDMGRLYQSIVGATMNETLPPHATYHRHSQNNPRPAIPNIRWQNHQCAGQHTHPSQRCMRPSQPTILAPQSQQNLTQSPRPRRLRA